MTNQGGTLLADDHYDHRLHAEIQISRRLSNGDTVREVLEDVPGLLTDSLECSWAVVLEISPEHSRAEVIYADGFSANGTAGGIAGEMAPDASLAGYVAALQRRACAVEDLDEAPFSSPPGLRAAGVRSAVAAKVQVFGESRYVVAAFYPGQISRRNSQVAGAVGLMAQISSRLTDALEKAELAEIAAFSDARQEFFNHLTGELDAAVGPNEALRAGADACVADLPGLPGGSAADLCVVDLVEENDDIIGSEFSGTQVRRFYSSVSAETPEQVHHSVETVPRLSPKAGPGKVIYSGEHEIVEHVCPSYLQKLARDEEDLERLERVGARSYLAFPLRSGRKTIGCVGLLSTTPRRLYRPKLWYRAGKSIATAFSYAYGLKTYESRGNNSKVSHGHPANLSLGSTDVPEGLPSSNYPADPAAQNARANVRDCPPRPIKVYNLFARGMVRGEIADTLHISAGTVDSHKHPLVTALAPVGAKSRKDVAALARRLGPVD